MNYLEIVQTKNCSSLFLVPCLGISTQIKVNQGYKNSYLADASKPEYGEGHLFLLFQPSSIENFNLFVDNEKFRTSLFKEHYSAKEGEFLVYKFPEKYKADFEKFMQAKYSEFSKDIRIYFPRMVTKIVNGIRKDLVSVENLVINKDEKLRKYWEDRLDEKIEGEIWERPNLEREKIKSNVTVTESY